MGLIQRVGPLVSLCWLARSLDSEVWEALRNLPERSVAALERLKFWPIGTKFHRIPIEPGPGRENWFDGMKSHLEGCSVVFLDPDNGLGKPGLLHASIEEVHSLQETIPAVVLIKFPGRTKHSQQIEEHHRSLLKNKNTKWVFTIRTCVSINCRTKTGKHQKIPRIRWFTVINPDQCITRRANSFVTKMKNLKDVKAEIVSMEGFGN